MFYGISTFFILAVIRVSISIPQLFNETNGYKYDFDNKYQTINEQQLALVTSDLGFLQPHFLIATVLFSVLGVLIYSDDKNTKVYVDDDTLIKSFRKKFNSILFSTLTISGTLVTIFSIWRSE